MRLSALAPQRSRWLVLRLSVGTLAAAAVAVGLVFPTARAQAPAGSMGLVVSRNVNMVSGQELPNGDPYL
ncbi:MAG: hypothetical protein HQ485_07305 [Acidobacteria bacterium]|jgi:hypothetical protein|nr:hypothetical protein [Acidobacteriota bacterium]